MRYLASLRRSTVFVHTSIVLACLVFAFALALKSPYMIDDPIRLHHSHEILAGFGLGPRVGDFGTRYYAPLLEFIMGISTEWIFFWLQDPFWIRHGITIFVHLLGLHILFVLLRRSGISRAGSMLAIAVMLSQIRLNGEALFNMKDAPGAMSYLVSGVAVWTLLAGAQRKGRLSFGRVTALGVVGALPFLIRAPLLTPLPFAIAGLFILLTLDRRLRGNDDVIFPVLWCLIAGCAFIAVSTPYMWTWNSVEWLKGFFFFKDFPIWQSDLRGFGHVWPDGRAPWWYSLVWIVTEVPPVALAVVAAGAILQIFRRTKESAIELAIRGHVVRVSLRQWMWVYAIASWTAFIAMQPKLFPEDRHFLFLFPPLLLACSLGLESLSNRVKYALAALILIVSAAAYGVWGGYSYAYKSWLTPAEHPVMYQNDFRFVCNGFGIEALKPHLTEDALLVIPPRTAGPWIVETLQKSVVRSDPAYMHLTVTESEKKATAPYYALSILSQIPPALERVKRGDAEMLYEGRMPDGFLACIVTKVLK